MVSCDMGGGGGGGGKGVEAYCRPPIAVNVQLLMIVAL